MRTRHLNRLLIVAILLTSTAPLYAQRQQQNVAKLKADARSVVGIIGADKDKTQAYCRIVFPGTASWALTENTSSAAMKKSARFVAAMNIL